MRQQKAGTSKFRSKQSVFSRRPGTGDFHGQWNFLDSWDPECKDAAYQNYDSSPIMFSVATTNSGRRQQYVGGHMSWKSEHIPGSQDTGRHQICSFITTVLRTSLGLMRTSGFPCSNGFSHHHALPVTWKRQGPTFQSTYSWGTQCSLIIYNGGQQFYFQMFKWLCIDL